MRLNGKVAIVTGASSGIGLAIAEQFLAEGAKVLMSDINNFPNEIFEENSAFKLCDVSKVEQVEELIKFAIEKFGTLDIIVNNAGIGTTGGILETEDATWDKTIAVNLSGTFYGVRSAARAMKNLGVKGSIINMSSILGKVGMVGTVAYCSSKGGIVQLTHAAALDLATLGIRVNAIAPGFIRTAMTSELEKNEQFNNLIISSTPLRHFGESIDIAKAAVYLASDESRFVTGEVMYVDGGWTAI